MSRRAVFVAMPLLVVALVITFGPAWQEKKTALTCDDGSERAVYEDMTACVAAMDDSCRACGVQQQWYAPFVYFLLVPGLLLTSLAIAGGPLVMGASAVWLVLAIVFVIPWSLMFYPQDVRMPWFLQVLAIGGPQLVFFPLTLFPSDGGAPGAPSGAAFVATIVFWLVASVAFGAVMARRVRRRFLVPLAVMFVFAIAFVVRFAAPLFGYRQIFESP
jgi:hypothetical protein